MQRAPPFCIGGWSTHAPPPVCLIDKRLLVSKYTTDLCSSVSGEARKSLRILANRCWGCVSTANESNADISPSTPNHDLTCNHNQSVNCYSYAKRVDKKCICQVVDNARVANTWQAMATRSSTSVDRGLQTLETMSAVQRSAMTRHRMESNSSPPALVYR
jgi:hypothetical protein